MKWVKLSNGNDAIVVEGICRCEFAGYSANEDYRLARIISHFENYREDQALKAVHARLKALSARICSALPRLSPDVVDALNNVNDPGTLADLVASAIDISIEKKQAVLEELNIKKRMGP